MNKGKVCVAAALVAGSAMAFDFVKDGVSQVTFEGADRPALQLAVKEYNRIVEKTTGAKATAAAPNRIAFAVTPELGENDTYEIRVEGWTDAKTGASGERLWLVGNNERSCWFAMCDILGQMGCRWFWEGEEGEYLPTPTKDLSLADPARKTTAAFPWRHLSAHPNRDREMWYAHNRLNPIGRGKVNWGQTTSWGGHSFNWIRPKDCETPKAYFEKYPEQWAEVDGIRVDGNHCYTNPDTIKTFQDWILRFWAEHPDCELLGLSPVDTPVYCTCEECAKHGDSSTLYFDFLTTIVNEANKRCPGRKYRSFAYSFYWKVPQNPLPPNVMLDYCMYDRCYMHALNDPSCEKNRTPVRKMADWKAHLGGVAPAVYGYHFDWGGEPFFVPQNRVLQDELKWARDFGVTYWHTEWMCGWQQTKSAHEKAPRETERIYAYRLSAYCLGRLLWDPDADLERIEGDWCKRVYGAAGHEMLAYFSAMESAWMRGKGHPSWYGIKPYNFCDGFLTPELIAECDGYFAAGEKKLAATDDERAKGELALEKAFWLKWRAATEKKKPAASKKPKKVRLDGTGKPLQD